MKRDWVIKNKMPFKMPFAKRRPFWSPLNLFRQAHLAIADIEKRWEGEGKRVVVITQNIDELHRQAGTKKLLELHGTLLTHWSLGDVAVIIKVQFSSFICGLIALVLLGKLPSRVSQRTYWTLVQVMSSTCTSGNSEKTLIEIHH